MEYLTDFALREVRKRVAKLGDKLSEIEPPIDWNTFRPIVSDMFNNKTEKGTKLKGYGATMKSGNVRVTTNSFHQDMIDMHPSLIGMGCFKSFYDVMDPDPCCNVYYIGGNLNISVNSRSHVPRPNTKYEEGNENMCTSMSGISIWNP